MRWVSVGRAMAVVALVCLVGGPLGTRVGVLPALVGLGLFALSALVALVGLVTTLVGALKVRSWRAAVPGALLALATMAVPASQLARAGGAPPIHDITTDLDDPPVFVAALPLREGAPNSATYAGGDVATQQRQAYPDISPMTIGDAPERAFAKAIDAARGLGWEVVASDQAAGRIEAVDTTRWFGFKDDVVVRLRPAGIGTRVDVRSTSRVGVGDAGTNARRVRAFLAAMQ